MFKLFLRVMLVFCSIVGIVIGIGFILPRSYSTNAELTINAPIEQVFEEVNITKNWTTWSPWDPERIDGLTVTFEGESSGQGAIMKWEDPRPDNRFDGEMELLKSIENKRVEYRSTIGAVPMNGYFEFKRSGNTTLVRWVAAGELPNGSSYGWYGLVYNGFLSTELKNSLVRLKEKCEKKNLPAEAD